MEKSITQITISHKMRKNFLSQTMQLNMRYHGATPKRLAYTRTRRHPNKHTDNQESKKKFLPI